MFYTLRLLLGLAEAGTFPGLWYQLTLFFSTAEARQCDLPCPAPCLFLHTCAMPCANPFKLNVLRSNLHQSA